VNLPVHKNGAETRDNSCAKGALVVVCEIGFPGENNFVLFQCEWRIGSIRAFGTGCCWLELLLLTGIDFFVCVVFHATIMPHAWIHQLSKQQLEELASQMGLPTSGTVDELRKRVKEKWTAIEAYLPSQSSDKSSSSMTSLPQRSDAT
jgi:hypothetical protein